MYRDVPFKISKFFLSKNSTEEKVFIKNLPCNDNFSFVSNQVVFIKYGYNRLVLVPIVNSFRTIKTIHHFINKNDQMKLC